MRRFLIHLSVSLSTFLVGVLAATLWLGCPRHSTTERPVRKGQVMTRASIVALSGSTGCNLTIPETREDKAVRLASEFITRNGYTALPPNRSDLLTETVETADSIEGMLLDRFDTLEPTPYGLRYGNRNGEGGYTVVFRYTNRMGDSSQDCGRAVTMDADFQNLRVEHKNFPLGNVHKKLR